ncbi:M23 family metallopeptidase [Parvularcula oceani]|uniref:M23 family metallopeptidase n=1 Tax=Parvularcula oceani TaxID=1247963 RepID=UPI000689D994|nr:M23 family metallopeptidase [Parvularcula oceani]
MALTTSTPIGRILAAALLLVICGAGASSVPSDSKAPSLSGSELRAEAAERLFEDPPEREAGLFARYALLREAAREEAAFRTVLVEKGGSLAGALAQEGFAEGQIAQAVDALSEVLDPGAIAPGAAVEVAATPVPLTVYQRAAGDRAERLARIRLFPEAGRRVLAWRTGEGWKARAETVDVRTRYAFAASVIEDSLFASGRRAGVPREVTARFANLFLYDVDFGRDIRRGDRFEVVYEVFVDEAGRPLGTGDILFAGLTWRGERDARGYYRFEGSGEPRYFDAGGESAERLLMKTPIEGARVTSAFGRRRHPISGYTRQHKGIDFGARPGTPIMAAGDGVIVRADWFGSFGNYVRIRHRGGFETAYAHLQGFGPGIREGATVRQGQVIAYVGSTGRSTGPHLHYEVLKGAKALNPMTIEVATGRVLDEAMLEAFRARRDEIDALRMQPLTIAAATNG